MKDQAKVLVEKYPRNMLTEFGALVDASVANGRWRPTCPGLPEPSGLFWKSEIVTSWKVSAPPSVKDLRRRGLREFCPPGGFS